MRTIEIGSEYHYETLNANQDKNRPQFEVIDDTYTFSGRTAIETVLRNLSGIRKALLPSYCCESMIVPFQAANIEVEYYDVFWNEGFCANYGIEDNDFVIVYVGRHNEIKGYGDLKQLGMRILNGKNNTKFLIAGKEGPLTCLENTSWIEIGYTKDPYSVISAGDVFLLPNKETYFDLVFIEVLSLGKIIVASRTGGNRYYEKVGLKGVFLYDTLDEAEKILEMIKNMPNEEKCKLEKANRNFYEKNLTGNIFYENYKKMMLSL